MFNAIVKQLILMMFFCSALQGFDHTISAQNVSKYLENKIPKENHRYNTFLYALKLLKERKAKTIVETGTSRCGIHNCLGDGCSTMIFTEFAKDAGASFFSVDIDGSHLANVSRDLGSDRQYVNLVESDSVKFLDNFEGDIDFLYLDSLDYDPKDPNPSQIHHLNEIIAAYPHLTDNSVVFIDDCKGPNGGKGGLVIPYLLERGWIILAYEYQIILIKQKKSDKITIDLREYEYKVYSQSGEDGVIQAILNFIGDINKFYVEFGTGNGLECNTRLLRENYHWNGLLMDGNFYNPEINLQKNYITAENINSLFEKYEVPLDFDLLSIDLDYNDFYVWHAIESKYSPKLVILEFNPTHLPGEDKIVVYEPNTVWDGTNYYGASITALARLGQLKGYTLVYVNKDAVNLFFIRNDVLDEIPYFFKDSGDVFKLYKYPKYTINGPNGGHLADPYHRPYVSSSDVLK